ncbi:LOW QUALITY PROTEIN: lysophospholipase-like protein 1 [Penaeus chinensis]|uniref:LOW QUALITY PROTEIN: lysophospholipase-like protein 1 n=1 Tax=Penaeus chinensis TaxID=139456 RepID=UPI001FB73C04|nr:LOW QUALITY PROTEIN: lysophospholipase-like protein 1 [Penaeus chinensis]
MRYNVRIEAKRIEMSSQLAHLSLVAQTNAKHTASVIFMHGSGGTGSMVKESMKILFGRNFSFPHIRILYPTAPERAYTPSFGMRQHVWFNRHDVEISAPEDLSTVEPMAEEINKLIDQEVRLGVDVKRIVLGGFSMGGSMALQMGYRFRPEVGGVFSLSSFLNRGSKVYEGLKTSQDTNYPPLFMCHGERDDVVPYEWGDETFRDLRELQIKGEFHTFPRMFHTLCRKELEMLHQWLLQILPEV